MAEARGWAEKFEKWIRKVPGMKGYQDKEAFRDSDKAVRLKIAAQLTSVKDFLNLWKRDMVDEGKITDLDKVDRVLRRIEGLADKIKFDSYGYSGYFDPVKIREPELERLYQFDLELFDGVDRINDATQAARLTGSSDIKAGVRTIEDAIGAFEKHLEERRSFEAPIPPV